MFNPHLKGTKLENGFYDMFDMLIESMLDMLDFLDFMDIGMQNIDGEILIESSYALNSDGNETEIN